MVESAAERRLVAIFAADAVGYSRVIGLDLSTAKYMRRSVLLASRNDYELSHEGLRKAGLPE